MGEEVSRQLDCLDIILGFLEPTGLKKGISRLSGDDHAEMAGIGGMNLRDARCELLKNRCEIGAGLGRFLADLACRSF